MHILCPHCKNPIEVVKLTPREEISCAACGSSFRLEGGETTTGYAKGVADTLGRFELLQTVGNGAFGTVFKARDPKLDRVVALKVPRRDNVGPGEQDLERFVREARSVAQLRHPAIVTVYEVGTEGDMPYLVSDFVEGVTLADLLTARRPSPRESAELIAAVAEALQHAHAQGVVHRDVKPSNIMIRPDGFPVVMDFGLAKRDAGEITMTIDGQVLGTPAYMSPEQARGEGHVVDGRSDVYSLGVILYQLLTGELPFRGNTRMLLHQVLHDEPKPPRTLNDRLPRDLETICLKAIAKEPGRRYQAAGELAADLRRFLAGQPVTARPVGRLERAWRWAKRKPTAAAAAALAVLAVAGVVAAGVALVYGKRLEIAYDAEVKTHEDAETAHINVEEQRKAAETARRMAETAEGKAREALRKMQDVEYFNALLIAQAAIAEGQEKRALVALENCKAELRSWEWYKLRNACHRELLYVKSGRAMAFCPTREEICCAEQDGTIRTWNLNTGRTVGPVWRFRGGQVAAVAYSQDGRRVAAIGTGIQVWEVEGGRELWKADGRYLSVAFSSSGRRLAAAGSGGVWVWEANGGRELWSAKGRHLSAVFSPDGRQLAAIGFDGLRLWEVDGGREIWKANHRAGSYVTFAPDGKRLAIVSKSFGVLEVQGGREIWQALGSSFKEVAAFSADGRHVAAAGANGLRMWEADGGRHVWRAHGVYSSVTFSPDGRYVASVDGEECRLWSVESGREVWKANVACTFVAFAPDGRRLAASGPSGLRVWEVGGDREVWKGGVPIFAPIYSVAFAPSSRLVLASGLHQGASGLERGLRVWEADCGQVVWETRGRAGRLAIAPDGRRIAAAGQDGLQVWEADRGHELWKIDGAILGVAFSPDGQKLATAGSGGLRMWGSDSGRQLWSAKGSSRCIAFAPNGRLIAVGSSEINPKRFGLWLFDSETGHLIWNSDEPCDSVTFTHDGRRLVSASFKGLRVYETKAGRGLWKTDGISSYVALSPDREHFAVIEVNRLRVLELASGHEVWKVDGAYESLVFSPDGRRLAARVMNGIRIWETNGGQEVGRTDGYRGTTRDPIAFSPDGRQLAIGGIDGLHLFDGEPDLTVLSGSRRKAFLLGRTAWHQTNAVQSEKANMWFAAAFHWGQLSRIEPTLGTHRFRRGLALVRLGDNANADKEFEAALALRATTPRLTIADCYAMLGKWESAERIFTDAATPQVTNLLFWKRHALLQLRTGMPDKYQAVCKAINAQFGNSKDPKVANDVAWISAIAPDSPDLAVAVELAQLAVKTDPSDPEIHNTLGALLYRTGKYDKAVTELVAGVTLRSKGGTCLDYLFLAMAYYKLGKSDEAIKSLVIAERLLHSDPAWFWADKLERQSLRDEATKLIRGKANEGKK